ncbi:MAG: hypothetical protein AAGA62_01795 [Bacteroidota bacterium]
MPNGTKLLTSEVAGAFDGMRVKSGKDKPRDGKSAKQAPTTTAQPVTK